MNPDFDVNIAGHARGGPGSYCGKYIIDVISETSDLSAANPKKKKWRQNLENTFVKVSRL